MDKVDFCNVLKMHAFFKLPYFTRLTKFTNQKYTQVWKGYKKVATDFL